MKKYIIILFVAIFAISCQDEVQWADGQGESQQPTKTEIVQETEQKEDNNVENDKKGSSSLLNFFVLISFLMSLAAFIMTLTQMLRRKNPSELELDNLKQQVTKLNTLTRSLEDSLRALKSKENTLSRASEQRGQYAIGDKTDSHKREDEKKDALEEKNEEKHQNSEHASNTNKENKSKGGVSSKLIYLGLNSRNFFTDISDEKTETSKFVASIIPGGMVATYEIIDVERIRSGNTSFSVKQKGSVAIKDASGIKHQEAGKIIKKTEGGKTYWVIDSPVIVEFTK